MKNFDISVFKPDSPRILPGKGRVLLAEPFMQGIYFSRSVILISEHNEKETIGFILDKPTDIYPNKIIEEIKKFNGLLYIGGPVEPALLSYIHTLGEVIPDSEKITDSIYYGGDFEVLKTLIDKGVANSNTLKFFGGYAGWSPGQLQKEIDESSWVVTNLDDEKIMQINSFNLWSETLDKLGGNYKTWINVPRNPAFN